MFPLDITALMFKLLFDTHVLFKLMICLAACFWSCYCKKILNFLKSYNILINHFIQPLLNSIFYIFSSLNWIYEIADFRRKEVFSFIPCNLVLSVLFIFRADES